MLYLPTMPHAETARSRDGWAPGDEWFRQVEAVCWALVMALVCGMPEDSMPLLWQVGRIVHGRQNAVMPPLGRLFCHRALERRRVFGAGRKGESVAASSLLPRPALLPPCAHHPLILVCLVLSHHRPPSPTTVTRFSHPRRPPCAPQLPPRLPSTDHRSIGRVHRAARCPLPAARCPLPAAIASP